MSKIYLPEKLVLGQEEKDLYPYHRRVSTSFCVAFTLNQSIQMYTGNRYTDSLDACLTAVSWVEDNFCELHIAGIGIDKPKHERIIKTCTLYMDRGGYLVSGHYQEFRYLAQRVLRRPTAALDDTVDKIIELKHNFSRKFINGTKENLLHKEIFIDKLFKIQDFPEFKINTESDFFKLLQKVSIYNRSMEMSFVYSIAQEKKIQLDNFKKIVGIVSLPITIEAYAWVKALQESISLINYLCTADDVMKLTDKLFEFRGPIIISDVYDVLFTNEYFNPKGNITPKPKKDSSYISNNQSALERFLSVKTIVESQIKNIKQPITEI
ncbi:hypothetical protein KRE43_12180 [Elizabethkingia meningoseptica]|uniref:hypothetical protein n=1 Tax=Elizabethkingia TaxID=308865 RepID=UPI000530C253|nr:MULTISPECIES: hypothetical protein [Elizabethkingia]KGT08744.1 hypothetical protein NV63_13335 [Elizabethkingia anophelis]MCT3926996.1 hypothetical protein [Elizabethkingia anophelis]MCT4101618.1 hypothetical protein [Elizabethkingia anophelis]MCT4166120.1 hypothetical protein [Elizabethkingia anophelis]MDE5447455.1 hypothetical protein [Elizabethkingia meningoseptica]